MKQLTVDICVCPQCVLEGAMSIMDSVDSLNQLEEQLNGVELLVQTHKHLGEGSHGESAPVVRIGEEYLEKATCENVMARVMALVSAAESR